MNDISATQSRRSQRSNVLLKATLDSAGESLTVTLRNLSQEGALVQASRLPSEGERVLFHRQGLSVPSRVAWAHAGVAGLEFEFPLFPRELLRHVPTKEQAPPPPIKRRPGFGAKPLTDAERQMIERWACEGARMLGD